MKKAITILLVIIWVAGLNLAGSDSEATQPIWNIAGLILFAGSSCGLAWMQGR